jgi:uncharacterized protein (TIGR02646 family)
MRPVDKGPGHGPYAIYGDALPDLRNAIGDFCSYCERQIETHLAVEHVQPKSRKKALLTDWSNFLLGCVHCNSSKGKKRVKLINLLWPDRDNTQRAFDYDQSGIVTVSVNLPAANSAQANATIKLVGLDKIPGHAEKKRQATQSDIRWLRRQQAFHLSQRHHANLQQQDTPIVRELIVDVAHGRGMFSIWMQAFAGDADMRGRLIQKFHGTAANCFDPQTRALVPRPGGQI